MSTIGWIFLSMLVVASLAWLREVYRYIRPPSTDNFDGWMSRGFRVGVLGAVLLGVWLSMVIAFLGR